MQCLSMRQCILTANAYRGILVRGPISALEFHEPLWWHREGKPCKLKAQSCLASMENGLPLSLGHDDREHGLLIERVGMMCHGENRR